MKKMKGTSSTRKKFKESATKCNLYIYIYIGVWIKYQQVYLQETKYNIPMTTDSR